MLPPVQQETSKPPVQIIIALLHWHARGYSEFTFLSNLHHNKDSVVYSSAVKMGEL